MMRDRLLIALANLFLGAVAFATEAAEETVLIAPLYSKETLLLNLEGKEIRRWTSERDGAGGVRLLEGGRLLRLCRMPVPDVFKKLEARGGGLEIIGKDGKAEWHFWNAVTRHISWGDALMLPNGNVLSLTLDWKSKEESIALGRKTESVNDSGMLFPGLMEIQPLENNRGRVVWEWHLYNHLGGAANAESALQVGLVSIHEAGKQKTKGWLSPANLSYDPAHDVIAFMAQGLEEVWLVDHSTTSEEAATNTGGAYGRGGRVLFRHPAREGESVQNRQAHLRGYRMVVTEKQEPVRFEASFVEGETVHEETVSVDSQLRPLAVAKPGSWRLPQKSPGLHTTPGYLEKADGDNFIATHLIEGVVVKFDLEGKVLWRYDNVLGSRDIIATKDIGEACCGNGLQDLPQKSPANVKATKVAPVYRAVSAFSN